MIVFAKYKEVEKEVNITSGPVTVADIMNIMTVPLGLPTNPSPFAQVGDLRVGGDFPLEPGDTVEFVDAPAQPTTDTPVPPIETPEE